MDLKKKGFQLPEKIRFEEETLTNTYGKLIAEPLERGFGTTIGNSLRRILLSSVEGAAVTAVRIKGALHEFSSIKNVKEDVVDIILNIKGLEFGLDGSGGKTATLKIGGPATVKGSDLELESGVRLLNPDRHIATLDKGADFELELFIDKGKGYVSSELNKDEEMAVDMIAVDSDFSPIKKVNYWVEKARVGRSTDYDRLILDITTNGSITPQAAVSHAASVLAEHLDFFIFERENEEYEMSDMVKVTSEDGAFNENLTRSVDELELSVRAHNCLKNAGIKSIADLVQKTEYDMLRTKNFGRKSLNEIKEILGQMGLGFGMRMDAEVLKKIRSSQDEA